MQKRLVPAREIDDCSQCPRCDVGGGQRWGPLHYCKELRMTTRIGNPIPNDCPLEKVAENTREEE